MLAAVTDPVSEWQELLRTDSTRKLYQMSLTSFCNFVNKTPVELLTLQKADLTQLIKSYVIHLKRLAVNTAGKPEKGQISVNSIPYYMAGVKSYLDTHGIELAWKSIKKFYPESINHTFRAYRLEELRRLIALADRREKVSLLLMVSGGLRVGGISTLKFKHLQMVENGIGKLHVYADSRNDSYWTLVSPECVQAIEEYKTYRHEQIGERITPESFIVRDAHKIRPILTGAIRKTIWELFKTTGLEGAELQPDHACRKYFNTICINAGMNHTIKECLMGHSVKLDDAYYDMSNQGTLDKVRSEYEKALSELTITEEARKMLSQEIQLKNMPSIEKMQAELTLARDELRKVPQIEQLKNQNLELAEGLKCAHGVIKQLAARQGIELQPEP